MAHPVEWMTFFGWCESDRSVEKSLSRSSFSTVDGQFLYSRIPSVENGHLTRLFFDLIILGLLLIISRVDLIVFVLLLEAFGVREY